MGPSSQFNALPLENRGVVGGHSLYIKDGELKYVYNFVGMFEQIVESDVPISTGHAVVSASFERDNGDAMPAEGTLTLHIGPNMVGEARIKTQPGKFAIGGRRAQHRQGHRRARDRRLRRRVALAVRGWHD